jgi:hypothetical protein
MRGCGIRMRELVLPGLRQWFSGMDRPASGFYNEARRAGRVLGSRFLLGGSGMLRTHTTTVVVAAAALLGTAPWASAENISGHYLEARTCQVYTGPCFANGESGLAGHDAVMAWTIQEGKHQGIDLAGLSVVVVVRADATLGFAGLENANRIKSLVLVDEQATIEQRDALIDFAKLQSGKAGKNVARIETAPIAMSLDEFELVGKLEAGNCVTLHTRKANKKDCICSNEAAYYPPLAKVKNFAAGVTVDGSVNGRGLGTRWSIPDTRSAYMATFRY